VEKSNAATVAICDAGPLIHLDELDSLDLLTDFRVWIPDAVWQEVQRHRPTALQRPRVPFERQVVLGSVAPALLTLGSALSLDAGETEALCIMARAPQALFLTDDAAARLAAHQLGYRVRMAALVFCYGRSAGASSLPLKSLPACGPSRSGPRFTSVPRCWKRSSPGCNKNMA